jgi:hypothetical protein
VLSIYRVVWNIWISLLVHWSYDWSCKSSNKWQNHLHHHEGWYQKPTISYRRWMVWFHQESESQGKKKSSVFFLITLQKSLLCGRINYELLLWLWYLNIICNMILHSFIFMFNMLFIKLQIFLYDIIMTILFKSILGLNVRSYLLFYYNNNYYYCTNSYK